MPEFQKNYARGNEHLGKFEIRLLGKGLYLAYVTLYIIANLDITVSGFRPCGSDAEGKQGIVVLYKVKTCQHARFEQRFARNHMVGRRNNHRCLGVAGGDMPCRPRDTGRGIAAGRLEKNLVIGNLGQLRLHKVDIALVGHYQYIGCGDKAAYTVVAHLEQSTPCTQEVDKLLGKSGAAVGPESTTDSAAHYHAITVLHFFHRSDCIINLLNYKISAT